MNWTLFLSAIGLVLILEGMMPFIAPERARQTFAILAQLDNRVLRTMGLLALLAGVVLLSFIRA
ncbi:MAG: DUF2065 domain-containing protein [Gammaproteobacteria bacterium]|nr:DUF2065 domain-containing protein [Gammaproteobacteria bacterium]